MLQKTFTLSELADRALNWYNNLNTNQLIFLTFIGSGIIAEKRPVNYNPKPKPIPRRVFTKSTKNFTLMKQGFVCNNCKKPSKLWDFHHKNGDRSDNSLNNCEALCPNCHAKKTRQKLGNARIR